MAVRLSLGNDFLFVTFAIKLGLSKGVVFLSWAMKSVRRRLSENVVFVYRVLIAWHLLTVEVCLGVEGETDVPIRL